MRRALVAALEPPRFPHFDAQLAKTLLLIAHSRSASRRRYSLGWRPNELRLFFSARRTRTCRLCRVHLNLMSAQTQSN